MTKPPIIGTKLANGHICTIALTVLTVRTLYYRTKAQVSFLHSEWRHTPWINSQDGGQTWQHPDSEVNGYRVMALAVQPLHDDVLLAGVWSGSLSGLGI
jgi:hypothetical protein